VDFDLSEEQELLQATLRGFVEKECPPSAVRAAFDAAGPEADASVGAGAGADPGLWKGLVELGVAGLVVPEDQGGAGLELLDLALVAEELGHGAVPGPFLGHSLAALALVHGGSPSQRERWLPALASGEALGTVALAEPGGDGDSWDPARWSMDHASGRLSGTKDLVPNASAADLLVVGVAGGGLALVETGAATLDTTPVAGVDRTRRLERVAFEDTPAEPLGGGPDGARATATRVRDAACVLLAADAFGAAWRLVRMAAAYAEDRHQFGRPIAGFQAVKHQLADMALDVDPTRGLWWYAAHAWDHRPDEAPRAAALAKAHVTDRAHAAAQGAVKIHGGLGFTWESDVQIWFKRTLFDRAWGGTPEHHRERIARLAGWLGEGS